MWCNRVCNASQNIRIMNSYLNNPGIIIFYWHACHGVA